MADNVIKVSVTSTKSQRVSVSSSQVATNITANSDTGRFWSQTSKNWAVSENIVDNEDYSSKYYANKSKQSAQNAESYTQSARETYNAFVTDANGYINELSELKESGAVEINEAVISGKDEINSAKTTILNDIEFVADGEKKEIEDLIDNGKEELKESIGDVKVLTTLEIGDIGFTQMAIDETKGKRRKLNGQLIIQEQYVQFTNIIKNSVALNPDLACTESEWQTAVTMSAYGLCDKFVIDDDAGTIRLPKYPDYFIGGVDVPTGNIPVVGNGMSLGFTKGDVNYGMSVYDTQGNIQMFRTTAYGVKLPYSVGANGTMPSNSVMGITTDATKSGIIAKLSNDQTEQIKGTYFIQVATGAETEDNIINEIELNNPFSLLDYKYSEYELNNLSWLRSQGQYNSKAIYPAVYDLLLKIYNGTETKAGVSVKLSTEEYTDYDFVLNTAEETFRLPLLDGSESLPSDKWETLTAGNSLSQYTAPANGWYTLASNTNPATGWVLLKNLTSGMTVQSSQNTTSNASVCIEVRRGDVVQISYYQTTPSFRFNYAQGNGSLYFYVGETVQNANLINAGRIEEIKANRTEVDGQWQKPPATIQLLSTTKYGRYDIDLSNYLPNDGYTYEILISARCISSGNDVYVNVLTSLTSDTPIGYAHNLSKVGTSSSATIPVGTDRKLAFAANTSSTATTLTQATLWLSAYRRLGTNQ